MKQISSNKKDSTELISIEKEICNFYEFCKENNFTPEEMYKICKPLTSIIHKQKLLRWARRIFYLTLCVIILYFLMKTELVSWHLSAIGRIFLIKLLPVWNWQPLFGETCLVNNFLLSTETETSFDCTLCEAIDGIPVEFKADPYNISEIYLDVSVPVIISDGLNDWSVLQNASLNIKDEILANGILSNSFPCHISTNMLSSLTKVKSLIRQSNKFKKWFFHFQNCEIDAVKQFRILAPRPYFLKPEISPVQYSWILMSAGYDVSKFKQIDLRERIAVFGQVRGSNIVKLTPRLNCADECPVLETELERGEVIVFNALWNLEYKPNPDLFNVAVILEMY